MSRRLVLGSAGAAVLAALTAFGASAGVSAACRPLSAQDLRSIREYRHLLTEGAADVWPGWRHAPPLLQRSGRCEYLVGHPSPPRAFVRLPGVHAGVTVYAAPAGTLSPGSVAAPWKVGSAWAAMVPVRTELQRAVDRLLGRGTVSLDDTSYLRSLAHEAFHAWQMTVTHGAPPAFDSTEGDVSTVDAALAAEGDALARALAAPSMAAARAGAALFESRRAERRRASGEAERLGAYERQVEWAEGTARYADLRLVLFAGAPAYTPIPGIRYPRPAAYRAAFLRGLGDRSPRPDGLRGRLEDIGAAEALLLDRLAPGWKTAAIPGGHALEDLLAAAIA
jgi:hypothetical protein